MIKISPRLDVKKLKKKCPELKCWTTPYLINKYNQDAVFERVVCRLLGTFDKESVLEKIKRLWITKGGLK